MKIVNIENIVKEDELFVCDKEDLKNYLQESGFDYISSFNINKTTTYVYIKNKELLKLAAQYHKENNLKGGENTYG